MAELLAQYGNKIHGFSTGQKIKGKIIAKNSKSLILDIGGKSEGVVDRSGQATTHDNVLGRPAATRNQPLPSRYSRRQNTIIPASSKAPVAPSRVQKAVEPLTGRNCCGFSG